MSFESGLMVDLDVVVSVESGLLVLFGLTGLVVGILVIVSFEQGQCSLFCLN